MIVERILYLGGACSGEPVPVADTLQTHVMNVWHVIHYVLSSFAINLMGNMEIVALL